jgi:hypothetical protein
MAAKLHRTPHALRQKLEREGYNLKDIRCDLFSVDSLAGALRVQRSQVLSWIELGWLPTTTGGSGKKVHYSISPEALTYLYRNHLQAVLKRGIPNQSLFEAYVQYCFAPKHTVGEQLLSVRRDKRERAAYEQSRHLLADSGEASENGNENDEADDENEDRYGIAV